MQNRIQKGLMVAVTLTGVAAAQDIRVEQDGNTWQAVSSKTGRVTNRGSFNGCFCKQPGRVECSVTTVAVDGDHPNSRWTTESAHAVLNGGQSYPTTLLSAGGQSVDEGAYYLSGSGSFSIDMYQDVPVKVVMQFALPEGTTVIARLLYNGKVFKNVPVGGGESSHQAPANGVTYRLPATQVKVAGKPFVVTLSDCRVSGGGYVCTSSVTPRK